MDWDEAIRGCDELEAWCVAADARLAGMQDELAALRAERELEAAA